MGLSQTVRSAIPLSTARGLAWAGLGLTAATHAAVLAGALPHTAVSGGRVQDPATGRTIAAASLVSLVPLAVLPARAAHGSTRPVRGERMVAAAVAAAFAASVPAQLLGTPFERALMAPTAGALAVAYARLAAR